MHSGMGSYNYYCGNQQMWQESVTSHPVTGGVGIGSTFIGTLADSEISGSDSFRLTVDLNIPFVPYDGDSEIYGAVGFDLNDMVHRQQWLCGRKRSGRKRKAPEGTTGGISMSGTSRTVSDFVSARNTSLIISESLPPEHQPAIDIHGISAGNTQLYSPTQSSTISLLSSYSSQGVMELLNGTSASVQPFVQTHSSSRLQLPSPGRWMTNSGFVETSPISHIPRAGNAGSSLQIHSLSHTPTASSFQSTHFPGVSRIALLSSSGLVLDLTANGVGDSGRAANFLREHSMISEIDPPPLPFVIGETVAADNEDMLVPVANHVRQPGHRDNPIVIQDEEEDGRVENRRAVIHINNNVGNMSYEELLELQARVGNANIGLRRRVITALLRPHKYQSTETEDSSDSCCICLDTYVNDDKIGELDCGHEFHYHCIAKWLRSKNCCPMCKRTALTLRDLDA